MTRVAAAKAAQCEFEVTTTGAQSAARRGILSIGRHQLRTPVIWIGDRIEDLRRPWRYVNTPAIMVNAYPVVSLPGLQQRIERIGFRAHLRSDSAVFLDSGGFLFQSRPSFDLKPRALLEVYRALRPDMAAILDYPPDPSLPAHLNRRRWQRTLRSAAAMSGGCDGVPLIPVIHGWSERSVEAACEDVLELWKPTFVALGGLVPWLWGNGCAQSLNGRVNARLHALKFVRIVRRAFPKAFLHVFGVGGLTTMLLLFALGVDSVDSMSWRIKAGHGAVMLPGKADRFMTYRGPKRVVAGKEDLALLEACRCPVCDGLPLNRRVRILNGTCRDRFVHNVWTLLREVRAIRQQIACGTFLTFAENRLSGSPLLSLLERVSK